MSFFERIQGLMPGGDQERKRQLEGRARGDQQYSEASRARAVAENQAAAQASRTAGGAVDSGVSPAIAARLAAESEVAANAQAGRAYTQARIGERDRAEGELAAMREARRAKIGQLITQAPEIAAQVVGFAGGLMGDKKPGEGEDVSPEKQKAIDAAGLLSGGASAAATAAGGPLAGMAVNALTGGGEGPSGMQIPIMMQSAAEDSGLAFRQDATRPAPTTPDVPPPPPTAVENPSTVVGPMPGELPADEEIVNAAMRANDVVLERHGLPRPEIADLSTEPQGYVPPTPRTGSERGAARPVSPSAPAQTQQAGAPPSARSLEISRRVLGPSASEDDIRRHAASLDPDEVERLMTPMDDMIAARVRGSG